MVIVLNLYDVMNIQTANTMNDYNLILRKKNAFTDKIDLHSTFKPVV